MRSRMNVLLVGNGINRLFGNESWESLIKQGDAMKRGTVTWDQISNMPANMQIVVSTGDNVKDFVKRMAKEMDGKTTTEEQITFLRSLIDLPVDCIITTNYTLEIEQADGFEGSRTAYARKLVRSTNLEEYQEKFRLYKYYPLQGSGGKNRPLWHIHGDIAKSDSMVIGHYYYVKHLRYIQERANHVLRVYRGCTSHGKSYTPSSWVDWFLLSDVHIVGLGLYTCEIDIWFLLAFKKLHFEETRVYYYGDCQQETRLLLEVYNGIIRKPAGSIDKDYHMARYRNAFADIENKVVPDEG